jgi:hypothetical protein
MRVLTITRLFAISVVLLGGTPAFAALAIRPDPCGICREQHAGFSNRGTFKVQNPRAIDNSQARENAASKTWPGDMILD